jgi:hypothetical protein
MQASAPLDEDMEGLTGHGAWPRSQGPSRRTFTARFIAEAVGGVCLLALLCWVIALSVQLRSLQDSNARIAPECIHALGGGPVGSGGSLHPVTPEHCKAQLRAYAQGPYWHEVELAAGAAMQVLLGRANPAAAGSTGSDESSSRSVDGSSNSSSVWGKLPTGLVQRVSRSLLAAAQGAAATTGASSSSSSGGCLGGPRHCEAAGDQTGHHTGAAALLSTARPAASTTAGSRKQERQQPQQGDARPLVVFDIDETLLSNMPQIMDPEAWPWEDWVVAARAEPLQPMLALYTALCRCAWVTARARM